MELAQVFVEATIAVIVKYCGRLANVETPSVKFGGTSCALGFTVVGDVIQGGLLGQGVDGHEEGHNNE